MNEAAWINLGLTPFVAFTAWAFGRRAIPWAILCNIIGGWTFLILMCTKKRPPRKLTIIEFIAGYREQSAWSKAIEKVETPRDLLTRPGD